MIGGIDLTTTIRNDKINEKNLLFMFFLLDFPLKSAIHQVVLILNSVFHILQKFTKKKQSLTIASTRCSIYLVIQRYGYVSNL